MSKLRTLNRRSQAGAQPEIFQGKADFVEHLEHFDKNTHKKKTLQVNFLVFFFLDTLKTTFWI